MDRPGRAGIREEVRPAALRAPGSPIFCFQKIGKLVIYSGFQKIGKLVTYSAFGSSLTITVSAIAITSSTGRSAREACSRMASGLLAW
jgi:hypothetical protein